MAWNITCSNAECKGSQASNIVDLINNHRDQNGWFQCPRCQSRGYIKKSFKLQERDKKGKHEKWEPLLRGIIPLGTLGDTYQPFVFLVSYSPDEVPNDVWFSYYKDTRPMGRRLKLGYGPGGPPVLGTEQILKLVSDMIKRGCLDKTKVMEIAEAQEKGERT